MREIVRNYFFVFVIGFGITLNNCVNGELKLTDLDLDIVGRLTTYLHCHHVIFLENNENINLVKSIRNFVGKGIYHAIINTSFLWEIFTENGTQSNFFPKRTAIVTKEKLQLTSLIKKAKFPQFLTWIVFGQYNPSEESYIPVTSEVIFINSESESISATQIYHLKPGVNEMAKKLDLTHSVDLRYNPFLNSQRMNFGNISMDMLVLNQREACQSVVGTLKKLECVHQEFLEMMGKRLNFSINIVECQEKEHPYTYPNGSDSELFLKLKYGEVDFSAIGHIVRRKAKRNYVDYVWPTFVLNSRMYLKQGRLAGRWLTYFRPLEGSVWWVILIWILMTGILIQIFEKALTNKLKLNFSIILDFISSILKALQVFCNQAMTDMSHSYSLRIIYLCKFFVVLIFFQAYCGYLVSSLTVLIPHFPFKDLKGFFENHYYRIMTLNRGLHQYYFRKVAGEEQRRDFMLPQEELPETIQEAVDKLCKENYLAFSEFREDFLNFQTLSCKIAELPTPAARLFVGIAMPKGRPVKEFLKRELLHLKSTGIAKRLGTRLSSRSGYTDNFSGDDFTTVSMTHIFSIFILLLVGIVLSILILTIELIVKRKFSSRLDLNKRNHFHHSEIIQSITMNISIWRICAEILFLISLSQGEDLCENVKVSAVVKKLAASLGIKSFTFIQNERNVGILQKIKGFPENGLFSLLINSHELEAILNDRLRRDKFFEKRTILITKEKLNFTRALEKLSDLHSATWMVFLESIGEIKHSYIPISSNFFTVRCTSNAVIVNKAYHIKPGLHLSEKSVRIWRKGDEAEGNLKIYKNPNIDFEKTKLNLLFLNREEDCNKRPNHVLTKTECYNQEIVKIIAEKLNFTVNKIQCPNKQFPYNFPNGSLSEMFLILLRREADISSGSYIVNKERMRKFDFAWPVFTTRSLMYIKYESATSSWRAYLRPIKNHLWSVIIAWIILIGFFHQFCKESRRPHFRFRFSLIEEFIKSVFCSLQVFCHQGVHNIPQWNSSRIAFTLSFFLCVSLYEAYCAFLISSLTVTTPIIPFTNFDEFIADGTYKIMTLKKGFHNYFIKKVLEEHGERRGNLFQDENDLPVSSQSGINMLCTVEKLAYLDFRENLVQAEIPCKILELPKPMLYGTIGLGFPKNSPYNELINQHITILRSSGILHRMRRSLLSYTKLHERETSSEQFINVSLWHVVSIFFIFGAGTVTSIVIFFLEICHNFSNKRKTSNTHFWKKNS